MQKHIKNKQVLHQNPYFQIEKWQIKYPSDVDGEHYVLTTKTNAFVIIIARDKSGNLILIKNWRAITGEFNWEFPMGGVDKGERPLTAAKREFMEETGYRAEKWTLLGNPYLAIGHSTQREYVYLAQDLQKITGKAEDNPHEIIEVYNLPENDLKKLIINRDFVEGVSLSAYTLYKVYQDNA